MNKYNVLYHEQYTEVNKEGGMLISVEYPKHTRESKRGKIQDFLHSYRKAKGEKDRYGGD